MTVQSMMIDPEERVVWCTGYTRGGAGCGPTGDNELRVMDVTDIATDDRE